MTPKGIEWQVSERERLEQEVVKAAKARRLRVRKYGPLTVRIDEDKALDVAVDALRDFEEK